MPGSIHNSTRFAHSRWHAHRRAWWRWGALASLATGVALLLLGSGALAEAPRCDAFVRAELANKARSGWSRVIVTTYGAVTPAQRAQLRSLGVDVTRHYTLIRGFACAVPRKNLPALLAQPFVRRVSGDVRVHKTDDYTVPATGADVAFGQYALDGTGTAVAVIDSGVKTGTYLHRDLKTAAGASRVVVARSFVTGSTTPDDLCGHGTHVAGIVGGSGTLSTGSSYYRHFYGIARNVNIVSLRVLDQNGAGNVSDAIAAIQWAVNNRAAYKIRVINLSLGHLPGDYYANDPLCQAVESAWTSGIVVVVAAGNGGRRGSVQSTGTENEGWGTAYGSIQSPGNDPYVITVGAMKQDPAFPGVRSANKVATYSARGPSRLDYVLKPDIVAPGNRVISTRSYSSSLETKYGRTNDLPWSSYANVKVTTAYYTLSGTSMAAPVVAGAAALMLQADPTLTPDTVKARLMISADKWAFPDGTADACTFGAGFLNIPAALQCPAVASTYAISPSLYQDDQGNVLLSMDKAIWGSTGVYPPSPGSPLPDAKAIWGDKAIWGSGTLSSSKAIWGDAIWGDKAIWGDTSGFVDLSGRAIQGE